MTCNLRIGLRKNAFEANESMESTITRARESEYRRRRLERHRQRDADRATHDSVRHDTERASYGRTRPVIRIDPFTVKTRHTNGSWYVQQQHTYYSYHENNANRHHNTKTNTVRQTNTARRNKTSNRRQRP